MTALEIYSSAVHSMVYEVYTRGIHACCCEMRNADSHLSFQISSVSRAAARLGPAG